MTPNELYSTPVINEQYSFKEVAIAIGVTYTADRNKYEFCCLCQKGLCPELINEVNKEKRINLRLHFKNGTENTGCRIYSVTFDGIEFMLFKAQGRWFNFYTSYVTNLEVFSQMQQYITDKLQVSNSPMVVNPNIDIPCLENLEYHY